MESSRVAVGVEFERLERTVVIVVAMLVLVPLYLATASWGIQQSNDPRSAAHAGWSLVATGSLAFDERWPEAATSWEAEGRDGRGYSNRFPGVIAIAAYAILAATGLVAFQPVEHPYEVPHWPATLTAVLIAALAAALTYGLFRNLPINRRCAIAAGTAVAVGSPLWSISADAVWTHGVTHVLLIGVLVAVVRDRPLLVARLAAAAVTARRHLIVALLVVALIAGRTWPRRITIAGGRVFGLALVAG